MKIYCFALGTVISPFLVSAITLNQVHQIEETNLFAQTAAAKELFDELKHLTPDAEYTLPDMAPYYAGKPLRAMMDFDAIMNPEKIDDKNKEGVCRLARTLGLYDSSEDFIKKDAPDVIMA